MRLNKKQISGIFICAALTLLTLAAFSRLTSCDFVTLDDPEYITHKPFVSSGLSWANLKSAFTETANNNNWHPLTFISLMLDAQLFGLKNPGAFHVVNLVFHIANSLLLFAILLRMTDAIWRSAFAAALFALHPLRVESVAWISERKDVLSVFFGLLAIWAYLKYLTAAKKLDNEVPIPPTRNTGYYWLSILLFIFSLLAKAMLVTFPFVLLLLDFWPLQRLKINRQDGRGASLASLVREKTPYFLVLPFAVFINVHFARKNMIGTEDWPFLGRLGNVLVAYATYVQKFFWPTDLSVEYTHPVYWPVGKIAVSAAVLVVISFAVIWWLRRRPWLAMGWFLFLGTLVPVSGLIQVGNQGMADRFTYFPFIGLAVMLSWGACDLIGNSRAGRYALALTGAVALAACGAVTFQQTAYWKNSMTLYTHALAVTKDNALVQYNMGIEYLIRDQIPEAVKHWTEAVRIKPNHSLAQNNLGNYLASTGNMDEAIVHFRAAVDGDPNNETLVLTLAKNLIKVRKLDEAIHCYETALKINPANALAHVQLAGIFTVKQDTASAVAHLQAALRLKPDAILPLNSLAWILATQPDPKFRNGPEATRLALRAVTLTKTNEPGVLDTLAAAYAETGHFSNAIQTVEIAITKANAAGNMNLASELEAHLNLYRSQQPYRE